MKRLTDGFAVLLALAAFAVSYKTQVVLAGEHGFPGWEAWLWPGIADAAALAMILRLHFDQVARGWYTVEAWLVFAIASAVMIGANAVADRSDLLGGVMHAVVPIVAMLVWHVFIHGRPTTAPSKSTTKERAPTVSSKPPAARTARRALRLIQRAPDVSSGELARRLGVSRSHAARLKREARQVA